MSMMCRLYQVAEKQLNAMIKDPSIADSMIDEDSNPNSLDIEKAWQVIHFLLTGSPIKGEPPLSYTVVGHHSFVEDDLNARNIAYLTPAEVKQVAHALESISDNDIKKLYDPKILEQNKIYPFGGFDRKGELDNYLSVFRSLVELYRNASKNKNGMVIHIG